QRFTRIRRGEQRSDAPFQPAAELDQFRITTTGVDHVVKGQWQIGEIADLAVAMPQPAEDAQHLHVALYADKVAPAYELVFTVADIRPQVAQHAPVALHPALHAFARPADVAVLEQRHEVVADGSAQ